MFCELDMLTSFKIYSYTLLPLLTKYLLYNVFPFLLMLFWLFSISDVSGLLDELLTEFDSKSPSHGFTKKKHNDIDNGKENSKRSLASHSS